MWRIARDSLSVLVPVNLNNVKPWEVKLCLPGPTWDVFVRQVVYIRRMASKTERLSIRLTPEQDVVLRRAAEVRGESTNDYVLRNAVGAAQADLADLRSFVANEDEWQKIESALSRPVTFNAAMVKLLTSPSVLER